MRTGLPGQFDMVHTEVALQDVGEYVAGEPKVSGLVIQEADD